MRNMVNITAKTMNNREILEAVPYVERDLDMHREKNKKELVKILLSSKDCPDEFTPDEISELAVTEFQLELDNPNIVSCLESLCEEDLVERSSGDSFQIKERPSDNELSEQIEPSWENFRSMVESRNPDVDFQYINRHMKNAFHTFVVDYLDFLLESSVELSELETDSIYRKNTEDIIDKSVEEHPLHNEELFKDELIAYLDDPDEELLKLVNRMYSTMVYIDLLEKEKYLDFSEMPAEGKTLILASCPLSR